MELRHEIIEIATAKVSVGIIGNGPAIIFLHGWPLSGYTFRKLIPYLQNKYTCYLIDIPGGGDTIWTKSTDFSWPGQAKTVQEVIAKLNIKKYYLFGQDSGAMIGRMLLEIDEDKILKFMMTNTEAPHHRPPWIPLYRLFMFVPFSSYILRLFLRSKIFIKSPMGFGGSVCDKNLLMNDFHKNIILPMITNHYRMVGQNYFLRGWNWKLLDSMKARHKKMKIPVHIVWGQDDNTFPCRLAEQLCQEISSCEGITGIEGAKVFIQEEKPEELSLEIKKFFC